MRTAHTGTNSKTGIVPFQNLVARPSATPGISSSSPRSTIQGVTDQRVSKTLFILEGERLDNHQSSSQSFSYFRGPDSEEDLFSDPSRSIAPTERTTTGPGHGREYSNMSGGRERLEF